MALPADSPNGAVGELIDIPFCPVKPTVKQAEFLLALEPEALYGGAAGGGKSIGLLMAAAQYVDIPGYAALILRRSIRDLKMPSGLIDRSQEWFAGSARWDSENTTWTFPSGARIVFGYLSNEHDYQRYQGIEFQCICFDELTQFDEKQYRYLFSRLRGPSDPADPLSRVPKRMRATTNPGGPGHVWVRRRFIIRWKAWRSGTGPRPTRGFYPARLVDNPHIDHDDYRQSLGELAPVERAQLRDGDWDIRPEGRLFDADWFPVIDRLPDTRFDMVRYWDLAATPDQPGRDPDYTAGALLARDPSDGTYVLVDVIRRKGTPLDIERLIRATAERDGKAVQIAIEEEPGSAGKTVIAHFKRALDGYRVRGHRPTGAKVLRAEIVAVQAEAGNLRLLAGRWNEAFLDEAQVFPDGAHDDQIDALAGAHDILSAPRRGMPPGLITLPDLSRPSHWTSM